MYRNVIASPFVETISFFFRIYFESDSHPVASHSHADVGASPFALILIYPLRRTMCKVRFNENERQHIVFSIDTMSEVEIHYSFHLSGWPCFDPH